MNYPEGSMRGSGIYSVEIDITVTCPECDYEWEDTFATDDWGNVDDSVKCPECSCKVNVTSSVSERKYDHYDG